MICPNCGESFKPTNSDCRPYCSEGCHRKFIAGQEIANEDLEERVKLLEDLVRHCWVHSGYRNCGYSQMSSELKALFDEIRGRQPG